MSNREYSPSTQSKSAQFGQRNHPFSSAFFRSYDKSIPSIAFNRANISSIFFVNSMSFFFSFSKNLLPWRVSHRREKITTSDALNIISFTLSWSTLSMPALAVDGPARRFVNVSDIVKSSYNWSSDILFSCLCWRETIRVSLERVDYIEVTFS